MFSTLSKGVGAPGENFKNKKKQKKNRGKVLQEEKESPSPSRQMGVADVAEPYRDSALLWWVNVTRPNNGKIVAIALEFLGHPWKSGDDGRLFFKKKTGKQVPILIKSEKEAVISEHKRLRKMENVERKKCGSNDESSLKKTVIINEKDKTMRDDHRHKDVERNSREHPSRDVATIEASQSHADSHPVKKEIRTPGSLLPPKCGEQRGISSSGKKNVDLKKNEAVVDNANEHLGRRVEPSSYGGPNQDTIAATQRHTCPHPSNEARLPPGLPCPPNSIQPPPGLKLESPPSIMAKLESRVSNLEIENKRLTQQILGLHQTTSQLQNQVISLCAALTKTAIQDAPRSYSREQLLAIRDLNMIKFNRK